MANLQLIGPSDQTNLVRAGVPSFVDKRKVEFLVLRSASFSEPEALGVLGITRDEFTAWLAYDEEFRKWNQGQLGFLQKNVGHEVLRARFMRCVYLQLMIDSEVLAQRMFEKETMDDDDRADAREALKRYSASNISAMLKALEPEGAVEKSQPVRLELAVTINSDDVDEHTRGRLGAKELLKRFTVHDPKMTMIEDGQVVDDEEDDL